MQSKSDSGADVLKDMKKIMSAIEDVVGILAPLQSDERHRVIQGAFVVLREEGGQNEAPNVLGAVDSAAAPSALSSPAKLWMKQNGLTFDELLHVFDFSDGIANVISSHLSGKNNAEKAIKSYALTGLAGFLISGESNFADKDARALCEMFGCYDSTNHSKYMKDKSNYLVGSKDKGWKLTSPGLKYAATIVKELAGAVDA